MAQGLAGSSSGSPPSSIPEQIADLTARYLDESLSALLLADDGDVVSGELVVAEAGEVHVVSYAAGVPGKTVGHVATVRHVASKLTTSPAA